MADAQDLPQACAMECPACRSEIALAAGESIGFRDACDRCQADLHVCLACEFHDPSSYNECRESNAERILDRERANRCEYFRPRQGSGVGESVRSSAITDLESLFKKD